MDYRQIPVSHQVDIQLRAEAMLHRQTEGRHGIFRYTRSGIVKAPVGIAYPLKLLPARLVPPGPQHRAPAGGSGSAYCHSAHHAPWNLLHLVSFLSQSSISSKASSPRLAAALQSPWRTKHMVMKLSATKKAA